MNKQTCLLVVAKLRVLSRPKSDARPGGQNMTRQHENRVVIGFEPLFSSRPKFRYARATQEALFMRVSVALDKLTSYDVVAVQAANDIGRIDPRVITAGDVNGCLPQQVNG